MDIDTVTDIVSSQLTGMTDENLDPFKVYALDTGEVFLKSPSGEFFLLGVTLVDADTVSFIDDDDWF